MISLRNHFGPSFVLVFHYVFALQCTELFTYFLDTLYIMRFYFLTHFETTLESSQIQCKMRSTVSQALLFHISQYHGFLSLVRQLLEVCNHLSLSHNGRLQQLRVGVRRFMGKLWLIVQCFFLPNLDLSPVWFFEFYVYSF